MGFCDFFCRQAFVALNVWQPEVVRSRQKQMVEQSAVPAECRIHALEMELKLCKQQIAGLELFYVSVDFCITCKASLGYYLHKIIPER